MGIVVDRNKTKKRDPVSDKAGKIVKARVLPEDRMQSCAAAVSIKNGQRGQRKRKQNDQNNRDNPLFHGITSECYDSTDRR